MSSGASPGVSPDEDLLVRTHRRDVLENVAVGLTLLLIGAVGLALLGLLIRVLQGLGDMWWLVALIGGAVGLLLAYFTLPLPSGLPVRRWFRRSPATAPSAPNAAPNAASADARVRSGSEWLGRWLAFVAPAGLAVIAIWVIHAQPALYWWLLIPYTVVSVATVVVLGLMARTVAILVEFAVLLFAFLLVGGLLGEVGPTSANDLVRGVQVNVKMADLANGPIPVRLDHPLTLVVLGVTEGEAPRSFEDVRAVSVSAADGHSVAFTGELPDSITIAVSQAEADELLGALRDGKRRVYLHQDEPVATRTPGTLTPTATVTPTSTASPTAAALAPVSIPLPSERIAEFSPDVVRGSNPPVVLLLVTGTDAATETHRTLAFVLGCDAHNTWIGIDRGGGDQTVSQLVGQIATAKEIYLLSERPSEARPLPSREPRPNNLSDCPYTAGAPTFTPRPTFTPSSTPTPTPTSTSTAVVNASASPNSGLAPTDTPSITPTQTLSATPTSTATRSATMTVTDTPTATATATFTPTATPTPTPSTTPGTTSIPAAPAVMHDHLYSFETQFRIEDQLEDYVRARGGVNTFGFPISRRVHLLGCDAQFFQRQIVQMCGGQPRLMNLLDPEMFPYTRVNGSQFPVADSDLKRMTPLVTDRDYPVRILDFVRREADPDFAQAYFNWISRSTAGIDDQNIVDLMDLEVWGAPISKPTPDQGFMYQRFQRGILQRPLNGGQPSPVLLADYLKALMVDREVPADLRADASGSPYFAQYCPARPGWLCRPSELPDTNLEFGFEKG